MKESYLLSLVQSKHFLDQSGLTRHEMNIKHNAKHKYLPLVQEQFPSFEHDSIVYRIAIVLSLPF